MSAVMSVRHTESLGIASLPPGTPEPDWAVSETLGAIIRTAREVVVICRAAGVPIDVELHAPSVAFQPIDSDVVSEPGLLTRWAKRPGDADRTQILWERAGFTITTPQEMP